MLYIKFIDVICFVQLTILNVLGYHVNWLEATGFTHLQVCFPIGDSS